MADSKNSFVVYTDIKETLDGLTDDQVATLFQGMVDYQLTGSVPEFEGSLNSRSFRSVSKWTEIIPNGNAQRQLEQSQGVRAESDPERSDAQRLRAKQTKQVLHNRSKTKQTKQTKLLM